jgi:hypothetical protein
MESGFPIVLGSVLAALVWFGAPVIACAISVAFFRHAKSNSSVIRRIVTASHGFTIAGLYVFAMVIWMSGHSNVAFAKPFTWAQLLPLTLILVSLVFYEGSERIHWLQIPNVACLGWAYLMGGMAITNRWL